ncbi:MAG: UDP-N-acetylmuramoyl-L-alanine--D-glutamate ligase [Thermoleophilia bacterium]|nr:UDP-N-acetylmuramoyl-L-alanine--D-glutamate ligase [Thermoleophilia bacterium]
MSTPITVSGTDVHAFPSGNYGGYGLPEQVRRVLVLGASRSGCAAASALLRLGREVVISDRLPPDRLHGLAQVVDRGARFIPEVELAEAWPLPDLVIKSPGVPEEAFPVAIARERGVPIWSELELAYVLLPNPFDCVTGTNGKTTTTALLGHLLTSAQIKCRTVGNIGIAVTSLVEEVTPSEELVTEVSSFQLENIERFRPAVGVFLNLTPDHLDRHGSMERYLACKANLFRNQREVDTAVLNLSDPAVAAFGRELSNRSDGPQVQYFSTDDISRLLESGILETCRRPSGSGGLCAWIDGDWLYLHGQRLLSRADLLLPGRHNLENCLAAALAAHARGASLDAIAEGLATFRGVAHRLEKVGEARGVAYINDSKATNVDATLTALAAFPERTHLILGGRDKASDYRPIARACARGCKGVYLIGEAAPLIEAAFAEVRENEGLDSIPEIFMCGDLEKAVLAAASAAEAGDVVLLAPACASFDQYRNYEERGEHFRSLVERLIKEEGR